MATVVCIAVSLDRRELTKRKQIKGSNATIPYHCNVWDVLLDAADKSESSQKATACGSGLLCQNSRGTVFLDGLDRLQVILSAALEHLGSLLIVNTVNG